MYYVGRPGRSIREPPRAMACRGSGSVAFRLPRVYPSEDSSAGGSVMARKPRNIIIYSDGTGQRGGVAFDERRSNIYKLYRATRCGPDSTIDPAEQAAFYDPGIG